MFFRESKEFISNQNVSSLGQKSSFIYFFLYVFGSILILPKAIYFPDFPIYDAYIQNGTASIRFVFEPISALFMTGLHQLDMGAKEYYLFTWCTSSIILFLSVYFVGKRYLSFTIFLMLNPINIIMFQTPRQFLGFCFFVSVLLLSTKFKFVFSFLAILAHSVSGVLSYFFIFLLKIKKHFIPFILAVGAFGFFIVGKYMYAIHLEQDGVSRGMGRLAIFCLQFFIIIFLACKKPLIDVTILFFILFFILILYQITPIAGRVLPFFSAFIFLYAFNSFKKLDSIVVLHILMISNILFSFLIISLGLFNFGGR